MTRGGSYGSDGFNVYHDGPSPSSLCFKVKHWDAYTCRTHSKLSSSNHVLPRDTATAQWSPLPSSKSAK
ncbi:hypothetical protein CCACVL1_02416 [Corchorus capsularis]|uniref:Uncharacterized protein n=1 Tax=Corchorus capsularis TaxID=210143 RepID=A0A1R3K8M9_COCAP|nr:hypothetical protein CCACVL1_02416 [Corchorus capsularis]